MEYQSIRRSPVLVRPLKTHQINGLLVAKRSKNDLQAQDQSLGLCLFVGVYWNFPWLERWTVNPYVASSSLARGASFLNVF